MRIQFRRGLKIAFSCLLVLAFFGCAPAVSGPTGVLRLEFSLDENVASRMAALGADSIFLRTGPKDEARTFSPSEPWAPARYEIAGAGPSGAVYSCETSAGSLSARLVPGEWTITVTAYASSGKKVATGTGIVLLAASRESSLAISLFPLQGPGSFVLNFSIATPVNASARISGSLVPEGFSGRDPVTAIEPLTFDIPADQAQYSIETLEAGFYSLSVDLSDGAGTVAGIAETVLVLEGHQTIGECLLATGMPALSLSMSAVPVLCLDSLVMQAPCTISGTKPFSLAAIAGEPETPARWFVNGKDVGTAQSVVSGALAPCGDIRLSAPLSTETLPLADRADLLAGPDMMNAYGSASTPFEIGDGPAGNSWSWRASLDARSATGPSVCGGNSEDDMGPGTSFAVKAIAVAENGLIAATGLDQDNALHLFLSTSRCAYGNGADKTPSGSGFLRLWREELTVGGSPRNADRLAFSPDGTKLAVSCSSGGWLRIYVLGTDGAVSAKRDMLQGDAGLTQFENIKALAFSCDGSRLYALANTPEALYAFDTSSANASSIAFISSYGLDANASVSISMRDLAVAPDGTVATSAAMGGKIFLFNQTADGLSNFYTMEKSAYPWSEPGMLAFSADGLSLYALCDDEIVYRYTRSGLGQPLYASGSIHVPAGIGSAKGMALGGISGQSGAAQALALYGGPGVAIIELSASTGLAALVDELIPAAGDATGADCAADGAFTRNCFIVAGGTDKLISLYGKD